MANIIIESVVLLIAVGIIYGCIKLIKMNPDIITGFEMSSEPEQRKKDVAWVKMLIKHMYIANTITLVGGTIGIISRQQIIYILSLVLPICFAPLFTYIRRNDAKNKG